MTIMNAQQARQALQKACKTYIKHSEKKLSTLQVERSEYANYEFNSQKLNGFRVIFEPKGGFRPGFHNWMSCVYRFLFCEIITLASRDVDNLYQSLTDIDTPDYFNSNYPFDSEMTTEARRLSTCLTELNRLTRYILIDKNTVTNFGARWNDFLNANPFGNVVCLDSDFDATAIFKKLTYLRAILQFTNTLSTEELPNKNDTILVFLNNAIPAIERVAKQAVIAEISSILDDPEITDDKALKQVAECLNNPGVRNILEKNNQSKAEHIFKVLSVILIAVGIGIIPTVILASKRLYDSGGKSINFFKPLSKQIAGDIDTVLVNTASSSAA